MTGPDDAPSRRDYHQLSASVDRLTRVVENLPDKMAATYVRKDVYDGDQRLHEQIHSEMRGDISGLQKAKWAVIGFVLAAVGSAVMGTVLIR